MTYWIIKPCITLCIIWLYHVLYHVVLNNTMYYGMYCATYYSIMLWIITCIIDFYRVVYYVVSDCKMYCTTYDWFMACIIAVLFDFTMYYTRFTKLYHVLYHVLFNYIMYLLCNIELYNVHSHIICLPIAEWPFSLRTRTKKWSRTASWPFSLVTYAKSYAFQQLSDPFHCGHTPKNDPEQLRDPFQPWHMQNRKPWNSFVALFTAGTRKTNTWPIPIVQTVDFPQKWHWKDSLGRIPCSYICRQFYRFWQGFGIPAFEVSLG